MDPTDRATAALINRLHLEEKQAQEQEDREIAALLHREDNEHHNKKIADEELASRLQGEEAERRRIQDDEVALADEQLASRLQREDLERQKTVDEEAARVLDRELNAGSGKCGGAKRMDDKALAQYLQTHDRMPDEVSWMPDPTPVRAESSATAAARSPSGGARTTCSSCLEEVHIFDAATLTCNHTYCRDCIKRMFESALKNDESFPARCCSPIPINTVRDLLPAAVVRRYEKKKLEMDTPDKTYCSHKPCGKWIPKTRIKDGKGRCAHCNRVTCAECGTPAHTGTCPVDVGMQQALDTARENNWQRCFSCRQVVELKEACNHITGVYL
jgi:hypothetical protein